MSMCSCKIIFIPFEKIIICLNKGTCEIPSIPLHLDNALIVWPSLPSFLHFRIFFPSLSSSSPNLFLIQYTHPSFLPSLIHSSFLQFIPSFLSSNIWLTRVNERHLLAACLPRRPWPCWEGVQVLTPQNNTTIKELRFTKGRRADDKEGALQENVLVCIAFC